MTMILQLRALLILFLIFHQAHRIGALQLGTIDTIPSISNFVGILNTTTLRSALEDTSTRFTIFAPDNDATFPAHLLGEQWIKHRENVLRYHIYSFGALLSTDLIGGSALTMSNLENVTVQSVLGSFALQDTQGGSVPIIDADYVSNETAPLGIIHVLDGNILKSSFLDTTLAQALEATGQHTQLLELVARVPNFIETATYTAFAPTDIAFAKVDPMTLQALKNNSDALTAVLQYHIIGSLKPSSLLTTGSVRTLLAGESVDVEISDMGGVTVNGIAVSMADILTQDGLIHSIDDVLLPPNTLSPTGLPSASPSIIPSLMSAPTAMPTVMMSPPFMDSPTSAPTTEPSTTPAPTPSAALPTMSPSGASEVTLVVSLLAPLVAGCCWLV